MYPISLSKLIAVIVLQGIVLLSNFTFAQDGVTVPEKVFAPRGSEAQIPCVSDAPLSKMRFAIPDSHPASSERMSFHTAEGEPNLLVMVIKDVFPVDSGTFICEAGDSTGEVELVVYDPKFSKVAVRVLPSNDVRVSWNPPEAPEGAIQAYKIYVTEVADSVAVAYFEVLAKHGVKEQHFLLEDLKPGATYDIQVSAVYITGPVDEEEYFEGPKSAEARVETPLFNFPPVKVKAEAWANSTILVTWSKPPNVDRTAIDSYMVVYKALSKKKDAVTGQLNVTSLDSNDEGKAILKDLPTRTRYEIAVFANINGVLGKKSQTIIFRHDGFAPELSINAVAIAPDTVLVTVATVGGSDVKKLRVLYSDDTASKWTRIEGCTIGSPCTVPALQPRSKYFFSARGRVDRKSRHVVTHVITPPTDLEIPMDLEVTAQTDRSIVARWNYPGSTPPIGFLLMLDVKGAKDNNFRPFKQEVVFGTQAAEVDGLESQDKYRAKVVPFDASGHGFPSDNVLFSIAATGVDATERPSNFEGNTPQLIEIPAPRMQVDANENISLVCTAIGDPFPMVRWEVNGSVVSQPQDRRNVLYLTLLQKPVTAECIAKNNFGMVSHKVEVDVSHGIDNMAPRLINELPNVIKKKKGESLNLRCTFNGEPTPAVTWYQMGRPIGQPTMGESVLSIPAVVSSATLRCEGKSMVGVSNHLIKLIVEDEGVPKPHNDNYSISMHFLPLPTKQYVVKWAIDRGNLDNIRYFIVTVQTENGDILLHDRLSQSRRQLILRILSPAVRYIVNLKTSTALGVVDDSTLEFQPSSDDVAEEPVMLLEVAEIRHDRARVDFTSLTPVSNFRLKLQDLGVRELGNTVMTRDLGPKPSSINLTKLKPNNPYRVTMEGTVASGFDRISESLEFVTASPGEAGIPVASRSTRPEVDSTTHTPMVTSSEPVGNVDITTATTTTTTTTMMMKTSPTTGSTTMPDTKPSSDDYYELRLKADINTPNQVKIRWTMDSGDLDRVDSFLVSIKGSSGQTLLEQKILGDQRSMTLQSLTPSTKYLLSVKAFAIDRTSLAHAKMAVTTLPADAVTDTSNPGLDFEANEIRSSSTRLEWTLVNGDPREVIAYRLRVLDRDQYGVNLLTQNMAANSQSIKLRQLPPSRQFYVILEAVGRSGVPLLTTNLTFSTAAPGQSGSPVQGARSGRSVDTPRLTTTQAPDSAPLVLNMEIRPRLPDKTRLNWTVSTGNSGLVRRYMLRVRLEDANGPIMLRQMVSSRTTYYVLQQLKPHTHYFLQLEAVGKRGISLANVSSSYVLPPPGHNVEPIRVSSQEEEEEEEDRSYLKDSPTIIYLKPVNSTAALIQWTPPNTSTHPFYTMLRYREKASPMSEEDGSYVMQDVPNDATESIVAGLVPGKTYMFEIARKYPIPRVIKISEVMYLTLAM